MAAISISKRLVKTPANTIEGALAKVPVMRRVYFSVDVRADSAGWALTRRSR